MAKSESVLTKSSIARMAGNIAAGLVDAGKPEHLRWVAEQSVKLARLIAEETERTEPEDAEKAVDGGSAGTA